MSSSRVVTKVLAAEEDLLFGEGLAQQTRAKNSYTVNKISIVKPVNNSQDLNDLDPLKYPKVFLVENGYYKFYQYNGAAYEELVPITKTHTISTPVTLISAISKKTIFFDVATPHSVSNISDGFEGQELNLISRTSNTTIANNSEIVLKTGSDYLIPVNTGLKLVFNGNSWSEV